MQMSVSLPVLTQVHFKDLSRFANDAIVSYSSEVAENYISEPHTTLDWFILLATTALPDTSKVALYPCGPPENPELVLLPLLCAGEKPCTVSGMSNFYSPIFGLPGHGRASEVAITHVARQLLKHELGFAEARFFPMDKSSEDWAVLEKGFKEAGWIVHRYFCFGNWFTRINGQNYDTYFAKRPSKTRNTVTRAQKKLLSISGYKLYIQQHQDEKLETAIQAFVAVYNKSWKNPEPFPLFIPGLCHLAAKKNWLRLGVVEIEGIPIAAQLWLVSGGRAQIVKLAYNEAFGKYSAGSVLTAAMMKHVIDIDGVAEIDYLMGDDLYKQDWMTERRERYGLIAFNPLKFNGLSRATRHYAGLALKYLKCLKAASN